MELLPEDSPMLRQASEKYGWDEIKHPDTQKFITELYNFMIEKKGIGIAAVQVGVPKTFIWVQDVAMFNPKILNRTGKHTMIEGCLTFGDLRKEITRAESITATWIGRNSIRVTKKLTGLTARIFIHEYEHTIGKVFIDD